MSLLICKPANLYAVCYSMQRLFSQETCCKCKQMVLTENKQRFKRDTKHVNLVYYRQLKACISSQFVKWLSPAKQAVYSALVMYV